MIGDYVDEVELYRSTTTSIGDRWDSLFVGCDTADDHSFLEDKGPVDVYEVFPEINALNRCRGEGSAHERSIDSCFIPPAFIDNILGI